MKKIIRVGVDFDGVLAYNPLRIVRAPITFVKRKILKKKRTEFYIPKSPFMKFLFWLPHEMSILPAPGVDILRAAIQSGAIEAHLVSGRYGYLRHDLDRWLLRNKLESIFTSINSNNHDEQPHLYKARMMTSLKLDCFIEDNLDIVNYLVSKKSVRVYWIYNIFDRGTPYPYKYPFLGHALRDILQSSF